MWLYMKESRMAAVAGAARDELEGKACGIPYLAKKRARCSEFPVRSSGQDSVLASQVVLKAWSEGQGAIPALRSVEKYFHERSANADLSTALRSGRDDKGEGGASGESGGRTEAVFITLGEPKAN
jgi:hypothetical protein